MAVQPNGRSEERTRDKRRTLAEAIETAKKMLKRGNAAGVRPILTEALRDDSSTQEARLLLALAYEQEQQYGKARCVLRSRTNDGVEDQELHDFEERLQDLVEAKKRVLPRVWVFLLTIVVLALGGLLIAMGLPFSVLPELVEVVTEIDQANIREYALHSLVAGSIFCLFSSYILLRFVIRRFAYKRLLSRAYQEWPGGQKQHECPACGLVSPQKKKCVHCGYIETPPKQIPSEAELFSDQSGAPPVELEDKQRPESHEEESGANPEESPIVVVKGASPPCEFTRKISSEENEIQLYKEHQSNPIDSEILTVKEKSVTGEQSPTQITSDKDQSDANKKEVSREEIVWWWADKAGERHGPCTLSELRSAVSEGRFNIQTMVWRKGDEWRRAKEVPLLQELVGELGSGASSKKNGNIQKLPKGARNILILGIVAGIVFLIFLITRNFPSISSPSAYELSLNNSAETLPTREQMAENFSPLTEAKEMSWDEYREYSARMMDWLELWVIPTAIELSKEGEKEQVDKILLALEETEKVSQGFFGKIQRPEYGGESQIAMNFRGFMPAQKLNKDREALYKTLHLVRMIRPRSSGADPSRVMFVNQMTDEYVWSTEMAIMDARDFERDQQHQWGVEEEE